MLMLDQHRFQGLHTAIARGSWAEVREAVSRSGPDGRPPPPAVDSLLKAGLLASQLLVSPNNPREKRAASLATFYVNEVSFALDALAAAAAAQDEARATEAWDFGRDSWNSYIAVVNPSIVPKVGDPFDLIKPIG